MPLILPKFALLVSDQVMVMRFLIWLFSNYSHSHLSELTFSGFNFTNLSLSTPVFWLALMLKCPDAGMPRCLYDCLIWLLQPVDCIILFRYLSDYFLPRLKVESRDTNIASNISLILNVVVTFVAFCHTWQYFLYHISSCT